MINIDESFFGTGTRDWFTKKYGKSTLFDLFTSQNNNDSWSLFRKVMHGSHLYCWWHMWHLPASISKGASWRLLCLLLYNRRPRSTYVGALRYIFKTKMTFLSANGIYWGVFRESWRNRALLYRAWTIRWQNYRP